MDRSKATPAAWQTWLSYVSVEESATAEVAELADVFTQVRRQSTIPTQIKWARDWRTRTFCDLALHLIFEHHMRRLNGDSDQTRIFADIQAHKLANHAQSGFFADPEQADKINVDRFHDTWGHQQAFCQDLIAYLFRPAPHMRRIIQLQPQMIELAQKQSMATTVRRAAKMELDSLVVNPLLSLHTLVEQPIQLS
jgi:hypothetical protein